MTENDIPSVSEKDIEYGGFTRFELELEFVQALANGNYLAHLAGQKMFDDSRFVAYLKYLQYWKDPEYAKYLSYPGPSLRALELLQEERFRKDILIPAVFTAFMEESIKASLQDR